MMRSFLAAAGPATSELSSLTDAAFLNEEFDDGPIPGVLHGRCSETLKILKSFQRIMQTKQSEVVLVHGESGSGKTSLVDVLRIPVCDNRGYFCAGKFFQNSEIQEPYSALMAAFSDLCELVSQSDDEERKNEIREALRVDHGHILSRAVSSLSILLEQPNHQGIREHQQQHQQNPICSHQHSANDYALFKSACRAFLRAMSSDDHPIIMFIDDIQWMDKGSRQLLNALLDDDIQLQNVMIVLAYRDEEVNKLDGFLSVALLRRAVDVQLSNLESTAVHHMVSAAFEARSKHTLELSDLIMKKTNGNAFHVKQFIETIENNGLAILERGTWVFDMQRIQDEVGISQTLAELLSQNIQRAPVMVQVHLQIAALLGFRFSVSTLRKVVVSISRAKQVSKQRLLLAGSADFTADSVSVLLSQAVEQGFIERIGGLIFQFSHDKIQTAFQSMIDDEQEEWLHLNIGETFLSVADAESVYHAAVHFIRAPSFIKSQPRRFKFARIMLEGAKYCHGKSAFIDAATFLCAGLQVLPDDKWSRHFDLTYEMSELLAKMDLIVGNFKACQRRTNEALAQAKSLEMKANLFLIDVEARMAAHESDDFIAAATRGLKALGTNLPNKLSLRHIIFRFFKVRRLARSKTDKEILSLPPMEDRVSAATVKLLRHISTYALTKNDEMLATYVSLVAAEVTLKGGLSPFSANALVMYAVVEQAVGNRENGFRFGRLALQLQEQIGCKETESSTIGTANALVTHWKEPLQNVVKPLEHGTNAGFDAGDIMSAVHCLTNVLFAHLFIGSNLASLETYMRNQYRRICSEVGKDPRLLWVQPPMQCIISLLVPSLERNEPILMSGEMMDESEFIREAGNNPMLLFINGFCKLQLAFWFGYYATAESVLQEIKVTGPALCNHFNVILWYFFGAVVFNERYRATGRRKYLQGARKYTNYLEKLEKGGCPNASAFLTFLFADRMSLKAGGAAMNRVQVVSAYNLAIQQMRTQGWNHLEGLANERLGLYLANAAELSESEFYLDRASDLYEYQWGSVSKYELLKNEAAKFILSGKTPTSHTEGDTAILGNFIQMNDASDRWNEKPPEGLF